MNAPLRRHLRAGPRLQPFRTFRRKNREAAAASKRHHPRPILRRPVILGRLIRRIPVIDRHAPRVTRRPDERRGHEFGAGETAPDAGFEAMGWVGFHASTSLPARTQPCHPHPGDSRQSIDGDSVGNSRWPSHCHVAPFGLWQGDSGTPQLRSAWRGQVKLMNLSAPSVCRQNSGSDSSRSRGSVGF